MAKKRTWTAAEIAELSLDEYEKHREELMEALKEGRIKPREPGVPFGGAG